MVTQEIIAGDRVKFAFRGKRFSGTVSVANRDIIFIQSDIPMEIDGEMNTYFYVNKRYVKKLRKSYSHKFGGLA
jgi:tRNA(Phe) wybutosine-synthesizing methylase Tyw3